MKQASKREEDEIYIFPDTCVGRRIKVMKKKKKVVNSVKNRFKFFTFLKTKYQILLLVFQD